jgi:hypothetical protein
VFSRVVGAIDVRILGRNIVGRGFESVRAAFAEPRRLVDRPKGAVDGLELLLARLQQY